MVSLLDLLCQGHLASDAAQRFGAGKAVSFIETGNLSVAVDSDHDGCVDAFVYAGFEEERYFVDDHGMGFAFGDPMHKSLLFAGDAGMDDAFELSAFLRIAEDDVSEGLAVERAVLVEDRLPKQFDNSSPGWFTWLDDLSRQQVGIDHRCAALLEHLGDGAFAGCHAACETDQNHGCGA